MDRDVSTGTTNVMAPVSQSDDLVVVVSVSVEQRRPSYADRAGRSARTVLTRRADRWIREDVIDEIGRCARDNARRAIAALEE